MTPDQIHPDHTYATTGGQQYRVLSITAGLVEAHPVGYPVDCSIRAGLSIFASLCVCDVTMAPESDQVEKVAQAQSQGPSRGDGAAKLTADDWMQIEMASKGCISGTSDEWPALVAAIDKLRGKPLARRASSTWLEGFCMGAMSMQPIARAEAANDPPRFRHRRTGDIYELLLIANEHAERTAQYPPTAVYRRVSDRTVWSRPVQDWGKDFEEVTGNE